MIHPSRNSLSVSRRRTALVLAGSIAALAASHSAQAAVKTWNQATGGNVSTGTWSPVNAPVSGDSLIFSNAGGGTVVFDTNVFGGVLASASSLAGITFGAGAGAYTLDLSSFGFNISNPNAIVMNSGVTNNQTIGTSAGSGTVFVSSGASGGTAWFLNSSTTNTLIINSNIANGTSGNNSIVFGNTNGGSTSLGVGNITVNGAISGLSNGVTKNGSGTLTLAGPNTNAGTTTINAGALILSGSSSTTAFTVNGGTYNLTGTQSGGALTVNGGNATSGSYGTLTESSAGVISGASSLTVNSSQVIGGTAGSATLAGNNSYSGTTTVGSISNNTASPYNIASLVAPTLTLSGANNGQGTMTVNQGATLKLDFGAAGAPTNNILNTTANTTGVTLTGGTLNIAGKSATTNSQQIGGTTTFSANTSSAVSLNAVGGGTLNITLAGLTRGAGSSVDFTLPALGTVTSTTTSSIGTNKVVVNSTGVGAAYATAAGGTTWATNNAGTIGSLASGSYQTGANSFASATGDTDVTTALNPGVLFTTNTLRFNTDGLTLTNTGASIVSSGGILVTANAATAGVTITGGTSIKSGTGNEMVIINNGKLTFNTPIVNASGAITVSSTPGLSGVSTFGGDNTLTTLNVTAGSATFSGNNTISGAITVSYGATLTLSGSNSTSSNFGFSGQGGGTLVLAGAGALGTGVISLTTTNNNTANTVKFASDVAVSTGLTTASLSSATNAPSTLNLIFDRASAGTSAVNETLSSALFGQQATYNVLQGSNYTTGFALPTLTVSGTSTVGNSTASGKTTVINASGANVSLGAVTGSESAAATNTFALGGTSTGNAITGIVGDGTSGLLALSKIGTGTWTLQGANTNTGATTVNGGTLVLDYGTSSNTSKISSTGVLTLSGGTLQLKGGSTAQAVASTTLCPSVAGQVQITQNTGSSTIALGAIDLTKAGALDIGTASIATTSSTNGTNGLLGGVARVTVGGADWAVSGASGTNPITPLASGSYTDFILTTGGVNTTNYRLTGSASGIIGAIALGTLKIAPSGAGQSLNLGSQQLTLGSPTGGTAGLLFTGSTAYTITSTSASGLKSNTGVVLLQDWSTAPLTLNIGVGSALDKYGTGKVILGSNATGANAVNVVAGTLQYSADTQLGNASTNTVTINGSYGSGAALVASTASTITNARAVALGAQGGSYVDVVGGGTLTLSGVISGTQATVANNIVTFGGASAVDATNNAATSGTIALTGANTYSGGTTFAAGTVNLGVAENAGANGPLGIGGTLTFTGGTLQYSASNNFDYSSRFSQVANQQFKIDTNNVNVTYASALAGAQSTLTKSGPGTLALTAANTYTGATTISAGTLKAGIATAIPSGSGKGNVVLDGGASVAATLDLNGFNVGINGLSGLTGTVLGKVVNNATGTNQTLTVGNGDATGTTFAGVIADNTSGTGTVALTKTGNGTQTLSGSNSYTGPTQVTGGTLEISGTISGNSQISVTAGTLLLTNATTPISNTSTLTLGSSANSNSGAVILGNSLDNVTETFASLTLSYDSTLNFGTGTGGQDFYFGTIARTGSAKLFLTNFTYNGTPNDTANDRLIFTGGPLSNFTDLFSQNDVSFNGTPGYQAISFTGGYEIVPVPEPSSTALIGAAALLGLVGFRERRRLLGRKCRQA